MNDEFERELRARLDRAVEEVAPRSSARSTALKRARRRRVVNAAVATGAAVSIAVAGFVGAAAFMNDEGAGRRPVQPAGGPSDSSAVEPTISPGETEIARGDADGVSWVLSGRAEGRCLTLTAEDSGESVSGTTCGLGDGEIELEETYGRRHVFAVGSVPVDARSLELEVEGEEGGGDTNSVRPLELFPAPADFESDRQIFVAVVPREAPMAFVVVDPEEPAPMNAIINVQPGEPDQRCWVGERDTDGDGKLDRHCVGYAEAVATDQVTKGHPATLVRPERTEVITGEESSETHSAGSTKVTRPKRDRD